MLKTRKKLAPGLFKDNMPIAALLHVGDWVAEAARPFLRADLARCRRFAGCALALFFKHPWQGPFNAGVLGRRGTALRRVRFHFAFEAYEHNRRAYASSSVDPGRSAPLFHVSFTNTYVSLVHPCCITLGGLVPPAGDVGGWQRAGSPAACRGWPGHRRLFCRMKLEAHGPNPAEAVPTRWSSCRSSAAEP